MSDSSIRSEFLSKTKSIIQDRMSDEHFGVSELADAVNMSRSNLLRKLKKQTGKSASQYIRKIRLDKAKELLEESEMSVSEISYEIGFSNSSYFIKCFREEFGFPPGESRKRTEEESEKKKDIDNVTIVEEDLIESENDEKSSAPMPSKPSFFSRYRNKLIISVSILIIAAISFYLGNTSISSSENFSKKKSIAVLPFKNMSEDTSNLYFVNGLMESSLSNLQKIEALSVKSRTSVEKYRNTDMAVNEIAKDLNVDYIVEGSGQKIGEEVLLHIQLIDAETDTPIWSEQYNHKIENIFELQNTVAKNIAIAIEATITPEELAIIDKRPTANMKAYDYYLQGLEFMQSETEEDYLKAIVVFENAVSEDSSFAMAYAQMAIAYYHLDEFKIDKKYKNQLNENADKALLYDSKSDLSLTAKALYYISTQDFNLAIPHLEKALEYNPNSVTSVLILSVLYEKAVPNTSKYLKYALKGVELNIEANDSVGKSYIYLHLSNALIQSGFVDEALVHIDKSLDFNPNNPYSPYLKIFIELAKYKNIEKSTDLLIKEWKKDTNRLDILQDIGKMYYMSENYKAAYTYYSKLNTIKAERGIELFTHEYLKIAITYDKMGFKEEAKSFFNAYKQYCAKDQTIYKPASLAMKHIYEGNNDLAIQSFEEFALQNNFQYWIVLFLEEDPLMKKLEAHPKYAFVIKQIKDKFWTNHEEIKTMLKENGLL